MIRTESEPLLRHERFSALGCVRERIDLCWMCGLDCGVQGPVAVLVCSHVGTCRRCVAYIHMAQNDTGHGVGDGRQATITCHAGACRQSALIATTAYHSGGLTKWLLVSRSGGRISVTERTCVLGLERG
jgi:hypothetical protein